jgi:hypothetical protein
MAAKGFSKKIDESMYVKKNCKQKYVGTVCLPLIGYFAEHEDEVKLLESFFDGVAAMKCPFVIFWSGRGKLPLFIYEKAIVVTPRDKQFEGLWQACDMAFCFRQKSVKKAFDAGVVPLVPNGVRSVANYDPRCESGNGFVFEKMNVWMAYGALIRAVETYQFPFDWKCMVGNAEGNLL